MSRRSSSLDPSPYVIEVADQQAALALDEGLIPQVVTAVLEAEGISSASISVALIDDPTMHELNRRHLDHDYPTDVLSFRLDADDGKGPLEGEILISTHTAIRQAAEFGWRAEDETILYLVHGLLHLCGYDDHSEEDRRAMRAREQALLARWNLQPRYDEGELS